MDRLNKQRLFQPDLCDVDIVLLHHQTSFQAHKGVLAAYSPFFHSLFASSKELRRVELSLETLKPQGLQQILNFIYTSKLLVSSCNAQDVLKAATVLQMSNIATSCSELITRSSLDISPSVDQAKQEVGAQSWSNSNSVNSNFLMEIKQEKDPTCARIYGEKSEVNSYAVQVGDGRPVQVGGCKVEGKEMENLKDSEDLDSFNREQIIVDDETVEESRDNVALEKEDDEGEQSEDDDVRLEGTSEEEGEHTLPAFMSERPVRQTLASTAHGGNSEELLDQDSLKFQSFTCVRCPKTFNNRWYLEKHMNVSHNRMHICDKCGKRFLMESELLLHQQTDCEKSIQVSSRAKRMTANSFLTSIIFQYFFPLLESHRNTVLVFVFCYWGKWELSGAPSPHFVFRSPWLACKDLPFVEYAREFFGIAVLTALDDATLNSLFWIGAVTIARRPPRHHWTML
uniref:Zinc finger and BTB domain containing 47a n=1 Tax=Sinocyclocheilus grahami TaxID=75366 RepID=A0A672T0Q3_SINGR